MIKVEDLTFEVDAPKNLSRSQNISVTIPVTEGMDVGNLLAYMRSGAFKTDFDRHWLSKQGAGFGMSFVGGPTPVFAKQNAEEDGGGPDRASGVTGYKQVISLNKWD